MQQHSVGVLQQALLAVTAVVALTAWWVSDLQAVPALLLLGLFAGVAWLLGVAPVWWHGGLLVVGALVALLVATTGGADSVYLDLFLVVVMGAALVADHPSGMAVGVGVAALGAATPLLYEAVDRTFLVDTAVDVLVWTAVGVVTWRVARSRAGHERGRVDLLRRYASVAEDERDRLADDLHAEAIQLLAAAQLRLGTDPGRGSSDGEDDARGLLADGLRSLRRVMLELKTPDVGDGSLDALVRAYAARLLGPTDVQVRLDVALPADVDLDRDVATGAYRIIVEALSNVVRHAQATTVEVAAAVVDGSLVARVRDDGRGLPAEVTQRPGHIGLRSMHDRAEVLGGHVEVRRLPDDEGGGTQVTLTVPLRPRVA